ncbi:DMT family transporter [Verrucomicrobiaceae bacterium N1E253]|uniref:DMT family transporter n=1 Tax=Oceaniferula marina TaxID=2748318 RepID=A0A851GES6_9BACT|nr:DMT family transporter [Oceaniferula marina]NWK56258.1 DMT family transporter [Oceaniferula marina]
MNQAHQPSYPFSVPILVMLGAFLFSSKGIFVKMMYEEGLPPSAALALRMASAFPFYLLPVLLSLRTLRSIPSRDWLMMAGLAFVGYFLSSLVNFTGLQYISVGLERVILFSYPTLVLLGASIFQKRKASYRLYLAATVSWTGLYLVIQEEMVLSQKLDAVLLGSGLILLSAMIYAGYILLAKPVIERIGVRSYTSISMSFSCLFVLLNHSLNSPVVLHEVMTPKLIGLGLTIGILGTVFPTYLLSYGLSKISSSSYAVISSVGPVATIALSLLMLGQTPGAWQLAGIGMSVCGSLMAARSKA